MNFCMGTIGAAFVTVVAATLATKNADTALAGLAITLAMRLSKALSQMVRRYGRVKGAFSAVDRITEYIENPVETQAGDEAPNGWPLCGRIVVEDLTVKYEGSLALDRINLCVESG